ncbi:MAG TPA: phosphoribosylformylglycinamidine synthase subunit PurS [Candidatus Limnocylindrales bacterium]|nr:phosphoribosylformylglycinamidine synthase subunit PurS [Candidatus Limnocylindrales bacterium]
MTFVARAFVMPKKAILDPQGKAVASSLHSLGYAEVADARLGKLIELRLDGKSKAAVSARVDEMCRRLLANDIIEDYRFEVEKAAS